MNLSLRRTLALALALLIAATCLGSLRTASHAAEMPVTDAYVLRYEGADAKPYLYGTRYEFKHSYSDPEAGENSVWTYYNCPEIFQLVSTLDGSAIAAYCTDADTGTKSNTAYRRINLEDASFYAPGAAGKLRAIVLGSFPHKSVAEVAAAANAAGYPVVDLQQGELISATQQAIWETAHGDKYTVDDHSTGLRGMGSFDEADFVYPDSLDATLSDNTAANMENLYNYFLSLEAVAPTADAVSEYTFENVTYHAEAEETGLFTVTVTYHIATAIDEGDALTLTATCGDQMYSEPLQAGDGSVRFTGLTGANAVKLEIQGYEQGGDVYLFDADGDRAASQSMIGYDDSQLPVYAQVIASEDRILNLYKTTGDAQRTPLANIEFEIYRVGSLEDYLGGKLPIGAVPTEADLAHYITEETFVATVKTDKNGLATYNFGKVDGVYLVRELANDVIETPADPFFVCVSTVDPATGAPVYTVNVYPKNTVITEDVSIDKDVTQVGNDHDTFAVGQTHTWIIQSSIPSGMATGLRYDISDVLDYRLTYQGNILVTVAADDAPAKTESLILSESTDYTVTQGTATDDQGHIVDTFTVALTQDGIRKVAEAAANADEVLEVRVYFDSIINQNAGMGQQIPNQAHVEYTNNVGIDYDADSDFPEVHTGGLQILKVDAQNSEALSGAIFRIARPAAAGETADITFTVDSQLLSLVFVDFYSTADLSGEKVSQVTTGEDGTAVIYGLTYGEYYLVETAAPTGYNKLTQPVAVTISAGSHLVEADGSGYVTVTNSSQFLLPETGGAGTMLLTVTGFTMILAAMALFILSGKVRKTA